MKKLVIILLMFLVLTGCESAGSTSGTFVCEGDVVSTFDGVDVTLYTTHTFYVTDGYLEKEEYAVHTKYADIEAYYNTTPSQYYQDLIYACNSWVTQNGFTLLMPEDTGDSIIVTYVTDYTDLSVFSADALPENALNGDKTKVKYKKFIENYYPGCKLDK